MASSGICVSKSTQQQVSQELTTDRTFLFLCLNWGLSFITRLSVSVALEEPGSACSPQLSQCLRGSICIGGICQCPANTVIRGGYCVDLPKSARFSPSFFAVLVLLMILDILFHVQGVIQ